TVPSALMTRIEDPTAQPGVTRSCTSLDLTWAEVTPPAAIPIVPEVVMGPPVRPDPVPTLVTVPPLLSSTSHTTVPSALMTRMDCPGGHVLRCFHHMQLPFIGGLTETWAFRVASFVHGTHGAGAAGRKLGVSGSGSAIGTSQKFLP